MWWSQEPKITVTPRSIAGWNIAVARLLPFQPLNHCYWAATVLADGSGKISVFKKASLLWCHMKQMLSFTSKQQNITRYTLQLYKRKIIQIISHPLPHGTSWATPTGMCKKQTLQALVGWWLSYTPTDINMINIAWLYDLYDLYEYVFLCFKIVFARTDTILPAESDVRPCSHNLPFLPRF